MRYSLTFGQGEAGFVATPPYCSDMCWRLGAHGNLLLELFSKINSLGFWSNSWVCGERSPCCNLHHPQYNTAPTQHRSNVWCGATLRRALQRNTHTTPYAHLNLNVVRNNLTQLSLSCHALNSMPKCDFTCRQGLLLLANWHDALDCLRRQHIKDIHLWDADYDGLHSRVLLRPRQANMPTRAQNSPPASQAKLQQQRALKKQQPFIKGERHTASYVKLLLLNAVCYIGSLPNRSSDLPRLLFHGP
jgi:hypothetical protein